MFGKWEELGKCHIPSKMAWAQTLEEEKWTNIMWFYVHIKRQNIKIQYKCDIRTVMTSQTYAAVMGSVYILFLLQIDEKSAKSLTLLVWQIF